jgi:translocator protein
MQTWYDNLNKPALTPPKRIFGPVWSVLYLLIFISLLLYFLTPVKPNFLPTIAILVLHFTAGFSWTTIFFGRKNPLTALIVLLFMDVSLAGIVALFIQVNTLSLLLLTPYCCWCLFATYLNWGIWRLNPGR